MEGLRQYVISVAAAALICGIVSGMVQNGAAKELVRLLCGLFLAVTALHPLVKLDLSNLGEFVLPYTQEAESVAAMGENMARESMADIIKAESEAYILDKAAELNAEITAQITVGDDQAPAAAKLSGEVSPYARQRLEKILESDLGIAKENQLWTG